MAVFPWTDNQDENWEIAKVANHFLNLQLLTKEGHYRKTQEDKLLIKELKLQKKKGGHDEVAVLREPINRLKKKISRLKAKVTD